jgi:hypothetical protein
MISVTWHVAPFFSRGPGIGLSPSTRDLSNPTGHRRRRVKRHLAVAVFDEAAEARLRRWLADDLLPREPAPILLEEEVE